MKYNPGDLLLINIKGYNENMMEQEAENGSRIPVRLYEIDPGEDGKPRHIAEEILDDIVALGADHYRHEKLIQFGMNAGNELVEIGEIIPGTTIEAGGIQMEILDIAYPVDGGGLGIFCLAKNILFQKAFDKDNCNNWEKSSLRAYLNGEYKEKLIDALGDDGYLLAMRRDLTSDDGMKDYGSCVDYISLISDDEYRRYRENISNKSDWWWTLTPYSCLSGNSHRARYVNPDGSLSGSSAYYGHGGVAPAFLFLPSLKVRIVGGSEASE